MSKIFTSPDHYDPYKVLGVSSGESSLKTIRVGYHAAKDWINSQNFGTSEKQKKLSHLEDAYRIVSDQRMNSLYKTLKADALKRIWGETLNSWNESAPASQISTGDSSTPFESDDEDLSSQFSGLEIENVLELENKVAAKNSRLNQPSVPSPGPSRKKIRIAIQSETSSKSSTIEISGTVEASASNPKGSHQNDQRAKILANLSKSRKNKGGRKKGSYRCRFRSCDVKCTLIANLRRHITAKHCAKL